MRYYYRCPTCLSTITAEQRFPEAQCVCGGKLRLLGPVTDEGHWLREELRPKCDGRCISALGPRCDCQCHGQNHGRGLEGTVVVRLDGGPVVLKPVDAEEARRRADEYREAKRGVLAALAARYGSAWDDYRAGRYIPSSALWRTLRSWEQELHHAMALQVHSRRVQRLRELAVRIQAAR